MRTCGDLKPKTLGVLHRNGYAIEHDFQNGPATPDHPSRIVATTSDGDIGRDLKLVLRINREIMRDLHAPPCAQRKSFDIILLANPATRLVLNLCRCCSYIAHRLTAYLSCYREIALQQGRRHAEGLCDIVKAAGGCISRKRAY